MTFFPPIDQPVEYPQVRLTIPVLRKPSHHRVSEIRNEYFGIPNSKNIKKVSEVSRQHLPVTISAAEIKKPNQCKLGAKVFVYLTVPICGAGSWVWLLGDKFHVDILENLGITLMTTGVILGTAISAVICTASDEDFD